MENYQIKNILIATAKRRELPDNEDTVLFNNPFLKDPVLREIHKESRKRAFISQEGRNNKQGKLPMNMIMSQTARRDRNSQTIEENCLNNCVPTFEGGLSSYRFPNEKIKPWTNKTKRIFNAPTVVDVIQSKYYQLYSNNPSGTACSIKDIESGDNIKQEDPLEASEFPKFNDSKKSRLRVKWEDESPMGFMKPSKSDINDEEDFGNKSCFIDGINLRKQNENPPIEHHNLRFSELYNEKDLIHDYKPPENTVRKDCGFLDVLKTEEECTTIGGNRNDACFQKNLYSSEDCFLKSVKDSIEINAPTPRRRLIESSIENNAMNKFNIPENEYNLPLTCDLFGPENDSRLSLTCDLFEVPNLEEEATRLDEQNDSECSIYESPLPPKEHEQPLSSLFDEDNFLHFQKDSSKIITDRSSSPLFSSESPNISPKEIQPKAYLSDPDDLLKTPKRVE